MWRHGYITQWEIIWSPPWTFLACLLFLIINIQMKPCWHGEPWVFLVALVTNPWFLPFIHSCMVSWKVTDYFCVCFLFCIFCCVYDLKGLSEFFLGPPLYKSSFYTSIFVSEPCILPTSSLLPCLGKIQWLLWRWLQ